jgi:hypothetical protein
VVKKNTYYGETRRSMVAYVRRFLFSCDTKEGAWYECDSTFMEKEID